MTRYNAADLKYSVSSRLGSVLQLIEIPHEGDVTSLSERRLQSKDLLPVIPAERKWNKWSYLNFWIADSFNLTTFTIASSMIGLGLNWWQAWLAVIVGYSIAAGFLVLNAIPGARAHIVFGTYARASFGVYGAMWPVFNRAVMAIIWYAVQGWIGGECVSVLLLAIFPSYINLKNGIPTSGTSTAAFLGFFLFTLISLVALWFPIHQIRHLFTVKAVVAPIAGLALFGWTCAKAGGIGPIIAQPATVVGSELGWAFVISLMSSIGNMATLITNATDFASRASEPKNVIIPQLIALPVCFSVVSLFGIFISSSSQIIYGEYIWNPLDLLRRFLDGSPSSGTRAGVAFIMIGFIVAQVGTNIAANSISAGCDLTALLPRYINIRRGGYICAAISVMICPWNLLASSNTFTAALSAYSVFLSSIVGVMLSHYYVVTHQKLKVDDLYTLNKRGIYYYSYGFNIKAYAAYVCGIAINFAGFLGVVGVSVPMAATRIYQLSFFTGFLTSSSVYIALNIIWPPVIPTDAECERVTIGTADWSEDQMSEVDQMDADEKAVKNGGIESYTSVIEAV